MKKKGFTLVELLAVIIILAIIALIAIPLIGNVIEKAKIGALESSVNGLVESADMYYANNIIKGETITETIFDWKDGVQTSDSKLEYKGKVENGKLILHTNGEVAVCVDDGEHYAYKNKDSDEIVSGKGACLYDGTTGDFSSNSSINDLRGKTVVATTITETEDGLNTLIAIPEEGLYDETSMISIPNSNVKEVVLKDIEIYSETGSLSDTKSDVPCYWEVPIEGAVTIIHGSKKYPYTVYTNNTDTAMKYLPSNCTGSVSLEEAKTLLPGESITAYLQIKVDTRPGDTGTSGAWYGYYTGSASGTYSFYLLY